MRMLVIFAVFFLMIVMGLTKCASDSKEHIPKKKLATETPILTEAIKSEGERSVMEDNKEVSRTTWTKGEWPLTVDKGKVDCIKFSLGNREDTAAIFIDQKGRKWALNGMAETHGYGRKIDPIWKFDESDMWNELEETAKREGWLDEFVRPRVNIGPLTQHALQLCGK